MEVRYIVAFICIMVLWLVAGCEKESNTSQSTGPASTGPALLINGEPIYGIQWDENTRTKVYTNLPSPESLETFDQGPWYQWNANEGPLEISYMDFSKDWTDPSDFDCLFSTNGVYLGEGRYSIRCNRAIDPDKIENGKIIYEWKSIMSDDTVPVDSEHHPNAFFFIVLTPNSEDVGSFLVVAIQ